MQQLRNWFCLLALCVPACAARLPAEANIPVEYRADNTQYKVGHCMWCCLQTMGRHQGVTPLFETLKEVEAAKHPGPADPEEVHRWLEARKVDHHWQNYSDYGTKYLQEALDEGAGFLAVINATGGGRHAVVVTSWSDTKVYFIDPNDPKSTYSYPWKAFRESVWTGAALTLKYKPVPNPNTVVEKEPNRVLYVNLKESKR